MVRIVLHMFSTCGCAVAAALFYVYQIPTVCSVKSVAIETAVCLTIMHYSGVVCVVCRHSSGR